MGSHAYFVGQRVRRGHIPPGATAIKRDEDRRSLYPPPLGVAEHLDHGQLDRSPVSYNGRPAWIRGEG